MIAVKGNFYAADEVHVPMLLGKFFHRVNGDFDPADWDGLRISHIRVITAVPPEGVTVTGLAERVNMTKQGCGQFVAQLTESGHLRTQQHPDDRRVRLVHRTEQGRGLIERTTAHMRGLEAAWASEVGERRFATFRKVLEELAFAE